MCRGKGGKRKKAKKNPKQTKNKTHKCLNNIHIRFPTYRNECYGRQTQILHTMHNTLQIEVKFSI